jgi:hypothetical protein
VQGEVIPRYAAFDKAHRESGKIIRADERLRAIIKDTEQLRSLFEQIFAQENENH